MKNKIATLFLMGITGCGVSENSYATDSLSSSGENEKDNKPNVLFIIMDDMCDWANYLGGNNQVITPNLDRLAKRSISFANGYAAVPFSNPSRASMLTGLSPAKTGIYQNKHQLVDSPAAQNCIMMPEHFHNNGYHTLWSGKVFHNRPEEARLERMWDDMECRDGGYGPWPTKGKTFPQGQDWREIEEWTGADTDFSDIVNSQYVIDFLGKDHSKPFFVAMGLYKPHAPYVVPKRFFDMYDINTIKVPATLPNDLDDVPQYPKDNYFPDANRVVEDRDWKNDGLWEQLIRAYLANVTFSDYVIGNILDALEASPYADNTIIVLVGDNGFHQGQKDRFGKMALWREACHVPFIVSLPKGMAAIVDAPVSLIDIYPTLASLCGLPQVNDLEGNDLSPLLNNPSMEWDKPCISNYVAGNFVVHYKNWNYIRYNNYKEFPKSHELYNIDEDEDEFVNLAWKGGYEHIIKQLEKYLPTTWVIPLVPREIKKQQRQVYSPEKN